MTTVRKHTRSMSSKPLIQGGFSDEVFHSKTVIDYIANQYPLFGYIGSEMRTIERDITLEKFLRYHGFTNEKIGDWITSSTGRHFMDAVYDINPTTRGFKAMLETYDFEKYDR